MLRSNFLRLTRLGVFGACKNGKSLIHTSAPKQGGGAVSYRKFEPADKRSIVFANCCGAFFWWWVFWHLFTDYEHIIGHFPFEEPHTWSDEHLGIPPDDAEDP